MPSKPTEKKRLVTGEQSASLNNLTTTTSFLPFANFSVKKFSSLIQQLFGKVKTHFCKWFYLIFFSFWLLTPSGKLNLKTHLKIMFIDIQKSSEYNLYYTTLVIINIIWFSFCKRLTKNICVSVMMSYTHVHIQQRAEKDVQWPESRLTEGCEPYTMVARNHTEILWKNSKRCWPLDHLIRPNVLPFLW